MDVIVPVEFDIPTYGILNDERFSLEESVMHRFNVLEEFKEERELALKEIAHQQDMRKNRFDKKIKLIKLRWMITYCFMITNI